MLNLMGTEGTGRDGKWHLARSGLFVPVANARAAEADHPKLSTPDTARSTAWATWATAFVAIAALVVSLVSFASQNSNNHREADRERRENASRVQTWRTADSIVIQNSSVMPVSAVYINWIGGREPALVEGRLNPLLMLVAEFALPPCARWTFSLDSPELVRAQVDHSYIGITFVQDGDAWAVDQIFGMLEGPELELVERPKLPLLEWRDEYAKVDAASSCAT